MVIIMSNNMTAVLPQGDYSRNWYPSSSYKLINRNALKYAAKKTVIIKDLGNSMCFIVPLIINYAIEDGYYTADYDADGLIIASAEETKDAMVADLKSQFIHAWDYYALEDDFNLNDSAKKVKQWLLHKIRTKI